MGNQTVTNKNSQGNKYHNKGVFFSSGERKGKIAFANKGQHNEFNDTFNIPFSGGDSCFSKTSQRIFTFTFKVCRHIKGSTLQQLGIVK